MQSCDQSCDFVQRINLCLKSTNMIPVMVIEEERRVQKVGGLKLANADGVGT